MTMETKGITVEQLHHSTLPRLDVRRAPVFNDAADMIAGASWHDPADVDRWAATLPVGAPVVVYCVHGHEVGQLTAARLRELGVPAQYLFGGIEAWRAAGLPLEAKERATS
jgi:Fe-Mn family superoxide dismutase